MWLICLDFLWSSWNNVMKMTEVKAESDPVATNADVDKEKLSSKSEWGPTAFQHLTATQPSSSKVLCTRIPCRIVFVLMSFFCFFNLSAVNLSVALVSMVNVTYMKHMEEDSVQNETFRTDSVVCESTNKTSQATPDGPFKWDSKQQSHLLAGLFYGQIVTQLPGGMLAERYGPKWVLLVGIGWTALWTILTPIVAEFGNFAGLMTIRILEGVGRGVAYPAMHVMLSNWAPPLERGRMATFVYAGTRIGTVVVMPVSGTLCEMVNWQSTFYVFGAMGIVWSVLWFFLVYDKPSVHPRITPEERLYIETSQGPQRAKGVKLKTPWLKIASSPAVYALTMGNFAHNWLNIFLFTTTPQYLSYILGFKVHSSGFVASVPFIAAWLGMVLGGTISDFLLTRRLMKVTWIRKIFVVLGFVFPAVSLMGLGYVNCEWQVAIFLLVILGFCLGLSWAGWGVNHLDIAPPFAGTLFGITNCISTVPGFLGPTIVGALTYRNQTRSAWRKAFYIMASVLLFATIVFLILGTGERQKWSYPDPIPSLEVTGGNPVSMKSTKKDERLGEEPTTRSESTNRVSLM